MASFWEDFGPGLLQAGTGLLGQRELQKQQERRRQQTQGPLYSQQIGLAGQALTAAGAVDPSKVAEAEYAKYLSLTDADRLAQQQQLQRELVARGQSGIASFGAVPGTVPTPGVPINPQQAALFAAQEGAKQRAAAEAQREGEARLDRQLARGGMLAGQAQQGLSARAAPAVQDVIAPRRPSTLEQILKAGSTIFSNPRAAGAAGGLFGRGVDWLQGLLGGGSGYPYNIGPYEDVF